MINNAKIKRSFISSECIIANDCLSFNYYPFKSSNDNNDRYEMAEIINNAILENNYKCIYGNIVILITFTDDYMYDAMEVLSVASLSTVVKETIYNNGRFHLIKDNTKDGIKRRFSRKRTHVNHMLIGGSPYQYSELIKHCDLSNRILRSIIDELYSSTHYCLFSDLINDGVLMHGLFLASPDMILKNQTIQYAKSKDMVDIINIDNADTMISNLCSIFNRIDIAKFCTVTWIDNNKIYTDSISQLIYENPSRSKVIDILNENKVFFSNIVSKEYNIRNMANEILKPLYKRKEENENNELEDDSEVDADFLRFIKEADPVTNNMLLSDETKYVDIGIDDTVNETDPEYNNVQE